MTERVRRLSDALAARGARLALAESCTGGLVAARLTARPGASRFLDAGLVVYSDAAKTALLGVAPDTLAAHGAVSEAVAREMLDGALGRTGADAAVAITGVAGPDGGTAEKPVGTVWIGAALDGQSRLRRFRFEGDRRQVRDGAADTALDMLLELLDEAS